MSKNLIPEIAEMLGVELGEEFKIEGREYIFHFVDNGLVACRTDGSELRRENCLAHFLWLINGEEEIVKLPWKPKFGEKYYSFGGRYIGDPSIWIVVDVIWNGLAYDVAMLDKGWVYRTREEAEAALPKVAAELGVDYEL